MITTRRLSFAATAFLALATFASSCGHAQNMPAASGPGGYIAVGGSASVFQFEYGQRKLGGIAVYADINPIWRYGVEAEVRSLRYHTDEDISETTYLAGPRIEIFPGPIEPYVKLLAGEGHYNLTFGLEQANFFTYAPGAGLDIQVSDHIAVRVIDFEYQVTPKFQAIPYGPYSQLVNYGISAGITIRLTPIQHFPKMWHYKKKPYAGSALEQ